MGCWSKPFAENLDRCAEQYTATALNHIERILTREYLAIFSLLSSYIEISTIILNRIENE